MPDPIRINPGNNVSSQSVQRPQAVPAKGPSFAETLAQKTSKQGITFSTHAQKRLQVRDINLTDDNLTRLAKAVEKVEKRGGRDSLVLMDDLAFIVNVKDKLIVTALDAKERGEGVFTQIDSVVLAD